MMVAVSQHAYLLDIFDRLVFREQSGRIRACSCALIRSESTEFQTCREPSELLLNQVAESCLTRGGVACHVMSAALQGSAMAQRTTNTQRCGQFARLTSRQSPPSEPGKLRSCQKLLSNCSKLSDFGKPRFCSNCCQCRPSGQH